MKSKNSILNKKKVLIFGGAGFLGKILTNKLLKENFFVISVDLKNSNIKSKNHKFIKCSIKKFISKKIYFKNL